MRVCILTSAHPAFDDRIFHKQARSLARAGHEVFLVAPHDRDEEADGVRVLGIPRERGRLGRMAIASVRVLRRALAVRADVYHLHDPELIPMGLFLRARGYPVIYDVHEYNEETVLAKEWIAPALRKVISRGVRRLDDLAARKMDALVVVNEDMARRFRTRVPELHSLVVVHNYPELPCDGVDQDPVDCEPVGVYVGALSKPRGLEVLLEAGGRLRRSYPRARLRALGPVELAGMRPEYASMDRWCELGLDYVGVVDHRDVPWWLRRAAVGLVPLLPMPSFLRSTPVKLFEYMVARLPIVASDFGSIAEIVRATGSGVLVPPGDPTALSDALESLLRDPARRAVFGQKGYRAVTERYNWGTEEPKLLALYEELGHRSAGRRPR